MMPVLRPMTLTCVTPECRVTEFYIGDWKDWEHEECTAWSALKRNCCPGCSEEGEYNGE